MVVTACLDLLRARSSGRDKVEGGKAAVVESRSRRFGSVRLRIGEKSLTCSMAQRGWRKVMRVGSICRLSRGDSWEYRPRGPGSAGSFVRRSQGKPLRGGFEERGNRSHISLAERVAERRARQIRLDVGLVRFRPSWRAHGSEMRSPVAASLGRHSFPREAEGGGPSYDARRQAKPASGARSDRFFGSVTPSAQHRFPRGPAQARTRRASPTRRAQRCGGTGGRRFNIAAAWRKSRQFQVSLRGHRSPSVTLRAACPLRSNVSAVAIL